MLARDGTATDPDYIAFPGVETGRVTGPLNQVLCDVSAHVQDGFHVKVVQRRDLLEFWAIESPLDWFTRGIGHNVGHRTGVSHGFRVKDLLVTLVALGELATGLAHPNLVAGCELQRAQAYHASWT